ncbi:WD repeat-containing protein 76-like [Cimex lectularius]|uniref:WD repeat-containing protein 76 n=1 Tax=Cimex lectularius TaxID=79782 RepID=A0A8I6TEK0_CIMLE|nr:WD repeat-containing protein 76-like [Cimex lectularius]
MAANLRKKLKKAVPAVKYVDMEYSEESMDQDEQENKEKHLLSPLHITKNKSINPYEEETSEYEKKRLQIIAENEAKMSELGLKTQKAQLKPKPKPKNGNKKRKVIARWSIGFTDVPRREPSKRLRNKLEHKVFEEDENPPPVITPSETHVETDNRIIDTVDLEVESREFFSNLHSTVPYQSDVDIAKCDKDTFQTQILSLRMFDDLKKVVDQRIYSLFIYPCTSKCLVLAGSRSGSLGVWDVMSSDEDNVLKFDYQTGPINCISSNNNYLGKIYTTSHDGTIKCIDLDSGKVENLYATSYSEKINHLTWHDVMDSHTLLFSHGNGSVGILDMRENKQPTWAKCYNKSCRTVQSHPCDKNYFLTSSGLGYASIFDIRKINKNNPISEMEHHKGLSSAFFSHVGNSILTTCNDDTVKIFDTSKFALKPKAITSVVHNNHTGQWLSVFKANWYPQRDDAFIIGSLLSPRRLQVYGSDGKIIAELKDDSMTTISPVIAIHPTLTIIAGGNNSGRVHLFWPPEMAKMFEQNV